MMQQTTTAPPASTATTIDALGKEISALELRVAEGIARSKTMWAQWEAAPPVSGMTPRERIAHDRFFQQMQDVKADVAIDQANLELLKVRYAQATQGSPSAPGLVLVPPPPPQFPGGSPPMDRDAVMLGIALTALVLAPLAIAYAWRLIRRSGPTVNSRELAESNERMRRVEQSVEAIAIEIERISESQRFLTRALTDTLTPVPAPKQLAKEPTPV